jgi:hypothetical protein
MLDPLLKTCFPHLLKMGWILIAHWAIYVKNEDLTLCFYYVSNLIVIIAFTKISKNSLFDTLIIKKIDLLEYKNLLFKLRAQLGIAKAR